MAVSTDVSVQRFGEQRDETSSRPMAGQQADDLSAEKRDDAPGEPVARESGRSERAQNVAAASPASAAAAETDPPPAALDNGAAITAFAEFRPGVVIDSKYRVEKVLGRGAMGVVAEATHIELGERVALKFLYAKTQAVEEDFRSRFRREAKVSAKLRNEHITRVIDVGVWREQFPYMVMDLLEGSDLRQLMRATGKLPVPQALEYIVQICEGVAEAHAHAIVHRDLKPSNLFVTKRADGSDLIKILDFGISKWSAQEGELDELTQTGVVLGSPKYMSPEQLFGSSDVDSRADVWSIGAIFYEMISGKPPFDFPTLARICGELASDRMPPGLSESNADVPPELEAVVLRCFERTPENRVQSVAELAGSVLSAVGAPFAAQVQSKVQSILDPKGSRDALGTSSSSGLSFSSGGYGSLPLSNHRIPVGSVAPRVGESTPVSMPSVAAPEPEAAPPKRRGWLVLLALVVLGGGAFYGWRTMYADHAIASATASAAPAASPPASVAASATTATSATTAPSASVAASASATTTASDSPTAKVPPAATWRPTFGGRPLPTAVKTAAPTADPTPPPPPTVTATTPPPPPTTTGKKPNPLEDRQ